MSQVINTNIASLNAQRNLNNTQGQLQTALQRLSSGLRINSAKDDAAGLAISERFTTQIRGQNQAIRNASDGISYSQTAEGALGEVSNLLQRIRELAVQSANATNSRSDREALNNEVKQAITEINRIAANTQFNDDNVLDGSLEQLIFQVGANAGQTILVSGVDARGSKLGAAVNTAAAGGTTAPQAALNALLESFAEGGSTEMAAFTITAANGDTVAIGTATVSSMADVVSLINAKSAESGVLANLSNDGRSIVFSASRADALLDIANVDAIDIGGVTLGTGGVDLGAAEVVTLNELKVDTQDNAAETMIVVDYVLQQVGSFRAELGALQNRFDSNISNLRVGSENLSASRSRILDADFAAETAELTRAQILQQAGTSVLAQANQLPNSVLQLLQ
ncbi:flagellin [Ectothiorhodospira lacustris]|uniref:flagellin N-terminal helical domain-containing protein n=1 Tax=Ectothiorhodospira lacustris TaxID=2899127 RepID=UPI001EE890F4|nr:flagellin [Ectothiorhodospira lacustris]MCG5510199.1 flagellin [Ectothiorhodospira lacustris]MCG5522042.1 flagellin [Ectothiorhodospira lacustris]